jgi:tetratricopeptide (TPR) repeat protein
MNVRQILWAFILIVICPSLQAQDLRDPHFTARVESGFEDIFNMDYEKAEQTFTSVEQEYPQHPAPPLYLASIRWLKEMLRRQDLDMNRFIVPTYFSRKTGHIMPAAERTEFYKDLRRSESLSNAILKRNSRHPDALYFLSTAYGLRSSFAITIDHSLREAFSYGNKAYSVSKQITERDPKYYDAYLTLGLYEYIVGSIPWYMRWMIYVIGGRGNKQDGIAHLKLASEKGQYAKDQAQLVAMVVYVREQRYAEGMEIARNLEKRFPRSYLFPLNLAQILRFSGRKEESIAILLQVEKRCESKERNFDKLPIQTFRFNLATELLYMGRLDPAQERFRKCLVNSQLSEREKALSHLRLGQILEWKGQRTEAIKEWQLVLSLENFDNSHSDAQKLLAQIARK